MKRFFIAPIVEGKGEVEAVPNLLQRVFKEAKGQGILQVNPALRVKAGSFLKPGDYFNRYVEFAARKAKSHPAGRVLIVLDCENHCPAQLGPALLARARQTRPHVPFLVALAYREYETWFLAAAKSLRGFAGLPEDLEAPPRSESIRGAKEWLRSHLPNGYDEVEHQPLFTEAFSFAEAHINDSFAHFRRALESFFR